MVLVFSTAFVVVGVALAAALLAPHARGASSAASPASSASAADNVLRIGWMTDPDNLNPFIGIETTTQEIITLQYDYLTDFDAAKLTPRPRLAESWVESPDHLQWTFKIRAGAKWQDGVPLTAADVAFTYNYIIDNEMGLFTGFTEGMKKIAATDDTTVVFTLSRPKANMLSLMVPILPEHIWSKVDPEKAGAGYVNKPPIVGSGPFQVVEKKEGGYVRMVANKGYWGGAPKIDGVIFLTYQNATTMAEDLKMGTLDGATELPRAMYPQFKSDQRFATADTNPYRWVITFGFNCYDSPASLGNPVLKDPAFRQALNYAIDKQKIVDIALSGYAVPADTLIISGYYRDPDWNWQPPAGTAFAYDPAKAGEALDAAGYKDANGDGIREDKNGKALTLRLWTLTEPAERQTIGKMLTAQLRDIGLDVEFTVMDEGALIDRMWNYKGDTFAPDYDMFIWGWSGDMDPNFILSAFTTGQIENWSDSNWSNSEYDRLYALQGQQMDVEERKTTIWQMQELMYKESPTIFIAYPGVMSAWDAESWQGWVRAPEGDGHPFGTQYFDDTYLSVQPVIGTTTAASSSSATVWIVVGAVAVVVVALVAWLLLRRRAGRREVTS